MRIIPCDFSENRQHRLANDWNTGLPCGDKMQLNKNIDRTNLKRTLVHEFRMKELNERLEQITMFRSGNSKK